MLNLNLQGEFPVMTKYGVGVARSAGSNVGTEFYTVQVLGQSEMKILHASELDRLVTESEMAFEVARAVIRSVNEVISHERDETVAEGWQRMAKYCEDMAEMAKMRRT